MTSDPGALTFSPAGTWANVSISFSSPSSPSAYLWVEMSLVSSTMITLSVPAGSGPPVLIRYIEPDGTGVDRAWVWDVRTLYTPGGSDA